MDEHHEAIDAADNPATVEPDTAREPSGRPEAAAPPTVGTRRWWIPVAIVGVVLVGALAASQVYLISSLDDTRTELSATSAQVDHLESQLQQVTNAVQSVGNAVSDLAESQVTQGSSPAPAVAPGALPPYSNGSADLAIGMVLGDVTGPDAYGDGAIAISPSDGTKRLWMIWAHWCPYCQEELPALAAAYDTLQATYPDIDIATVTTSIDPSRGNPLDAYLEAEQFPFPVIVDPDLRLASQLGVSAFPFWIVTDGQGHVLFRTAGYLSEAQIDGLMQNLDEYDPSA